mgnify:CR=1 FL=1|tara:strand:+ start:433 stop:2406 length:1974 start_codon:yes stop_codon:yes gene_type:complete
MPKIPTYRTQGRATTEVGSIKTNIQAPLNTALADVGSTIARYYVAEKQEEAKIKSAEYENESWSGLYDIIDKHKNNPYPTDAANAYLQDVENYKNNFLSTKLTKENKFTKDSFLQKFNSNRDTGLLAVQKGSRIQLDNNKANQDSMFGSGLNTKIRLNPAFAPKALIEAENYVNTNYSDSNEKKIKFEFFSKSISATKLDMELPEVLLAKLKKDPNLYSDVPEEKEAAIKFAMNKVAENQEAAFTDNISRLVANTPYGQQSDTNALLGSQIKEYYSDPKDHAKAINLAETLFKTKRNTIQKEGAGEYFINNDPAIKKLYDQSLTDGTRFKTFVQSLDQVFDKQKIPKDLRTYLPNDKILEIKDIIEATPGSKEKLRVVDSLKSLYGDKMPIINKQLFDKVGAGVAMAVSSNDLDVRSLSILGKVSEDNNKLLNARFDGDERNLEGKLLKKIESNLSPLQNVISNQPEGFKRNSSYVAKITTALKDAAMNGLLDDKYDSTSSAANKISQGFLDDYVLTHDTFYIPSDVNGDVVNTDFIEAKAKVFETKLYFNNIDLTNFDVTLIGEGGKPLSKQDTINVFKKNGEWYMDGNTGLKYGVKESSGGFTPMKINGENVTINFLDYDGEFKSMKDAFGNSYVMKLTDIYTFINSEFEGQQSP